MVASHRARALLRAGEPWLFLCSAFLLTALLTRSFLLQSDEGYTLGAAWQLWNGRKMYVDFRLFAGPGSGYAVYWLWKLWGSASPLPARLLALLFSFSSTVALYLLLRRRGVRGLNLAFATIAWMIVGSLYVPLNHNSFSSYAALWFLLVLERLVSELSARPDGRRAILWAGVAGAVAGLVFAFLPTKGGLLAGAAEAYLLIVGLRRRALRPALAFAAAFALAILPLVATWGLSTLIRQWLLIPLTANYLGHTGASHPFVVAALVLTGSMLGVAFSLRDPWLKVVALVQAALYASMSHNMELAHFAINSFPVVVFASLALHRRYSASLLEQGLPAGAVMSGITIVLLAWAAGSPGGADFLSTSTLRVDLLGHRPRAFTSPKIAAARTIYAGPFLPGLYYLLGKENPFFVTESVVCDRACHEQLIAELAAVRPDLVFLNYPMVRHLSYDENAPVDVYLRENYVLCPGHGEMTVRARDARLCP
jgi:hypothetical protein